MEEINQFELEGLEEIAALWLGAGDIAGIPLAGPRAVAAGLEPGNAVYAAAGVRTRPPHCQRSPMAQCLVPAAVDCPCRRRHRESPAGP